jgi:hypothetical protein
LVNLLAIFFQTLSTIRMVDLSPSSHIGKIDKANAWHAYIYRTQRQGLHAVVSPEYR